MELWPTASEVAASREENLIGATFKMVSMNSLLSGCVTLILPVVNLSQKGDKLAALSLRVTPGSNSGGSEPSRKATSRG